jgi:hypothetical protein
MLGCACDPWPARRAPACDRVPELAVPRARAARGGRTAGEDENPKAPSRRLHPRRVGAARMPMEDPAGPG